MTLTASDDEYLVKRVQGPRLGPVTVTASTGEILDEATLARVLGHQSKDVFENIFAFTLDELHSDDLLKDEKVNSQIYSAGMGVTTLPRALKQLADKRGRTVPQRREQPRDRKGRQQAERGRVQAQRGRGQR